jgi:dTDP-4-dehydrorhamnose 3,5-epimerase-like enzyme
MSVKTFDSIPDLKLVDLPHFIDDRGFLMEILRSTDLQPVPGLDGAMSMVPGDEFGHAQAPIIRQVYLVSNPMPTVRAFHKHDHLVDYFCVVQGSAIFGFADDREGLVQKALRSPHGGDDVVNLQLCVQRVVCSARKPQMIVVPAGVHHGWASLEPNTIMVSVGSTRYNTKDHDEYRIPPNSLDAAFGGSPWEVEGK